MNDEEMSDGEESHHDLASDWSFGGHRGVDVEGDDDDERPSRRSGV